VTTRFDINLDDYEDFDSKDFWRPKKRADSKYLDDMWASSSFRSAGAWDGEVGDNTLAGKENILIAHRMVESFINAFARDEGRYLVTFDPNVGTAGTDMRTRRVTITPAPILDPDITPEHAGRILTGLGVHEICHPRYGKGTFEAVRKAFPFSESAWRIGDLLDDVRIERRYVDDYPGYSGVFDPTLEYIASGYVKKNGGKKLVIDPKDHLNIMSGAIRYSDAIDWSDRRVARERDWWNSWCEKWAREDSPRRHVEAVREALQFIVAQDQKLEVEVKGAGSGEGSGKGEKTLGDGGDQQADDGAGGTPDKADSKPDESDGNDGLSKSGAEDGNNDVGGGAGEEKGEEKIDAEAIEQAVEALTDEQLSAAADKIAGSAPLADKLPTCAGERAVENAAVSAGVDPQDISDEKQEAQNAVVEAEYYEEAGNGLKVDVARSLRDISLAGRGNYRKYFQPSPQASRSIRDAILQSRTGHTNVSRFQKRGRIDQKGLHRVASHDYRLFDRKHAESPGKYLIWILLDRSSSMDGSESIQQAQVAEAIASATQHVKTVRAAVWAWSHSFRGRGIPGVAKAWETGQKTDDIKKTIDLPSGGTPDATIMGWAYRAIKREVRGSEQPVIFLCSDGFGSSRMTETVAEARRAGVRVVSVAFGSLDEETQKQRFGPDGYIKWEGSIAKTARPLAKMIAKMVGRDRR
jgi:hypothetical protein